MLAWRAMLLGMVIAAPTPDSSRPVGAGFPEMAPGFETVLVGEESSVKETRRRGTWEMVAHQLALTRPHGFGDNYWFSTHPGATLSDGAVRARVRFHGRVDASIMFRCRLPQGDLERLTGYGLSIEGDVLRYYFWEEGFPRPIGAPAKVPGLTKRSGIEVVMWMAGPLVSALAYDVETLALLATLTVNNGQQVRGVVGFRAHRRHSPKSRLTFLSTLSAGEARRERPRAARSGRVAFVRRDDERRIPSELKDAVVERRSDRIVLHLTPLQLARLRRADVVPTQVTHRVPWKYVDPVFLGAKERGLLTTARGFQIDNGYKDPEMVETLLAAYHQRFPALTRLESLGKTAQGRSIWALKISDNAAQDEAEPAVMLNGSHHGNEMLATEFVLDAIQQLLEGYASNPSIRRRVDNLEIWCVPLVNPDGRQVFLQETMVAGRKNHRDVDGDGRIDDREGVDLNRNYPFQWGVLGEIGSRSWPEHSGYRGPAPGSEPETRALMGLAEREYFAAAISYHTAATVVMPPYASDAVRAPTNDEAWVVAQAVAAAAPLQPNNRRYRVIRRLTPVDGVEKDWLRFHFGTVALVVEGPAQNPRDPARRQRCVELTRPIGMALLDRFLDGPSVWGQVKDTQGRPVVAEVRLSAVQPRSGEKWRTRPRDGLFARFLPYRGTCRVRVSAPGFVTQEEEITVNAGFQKMDFALTAATSAAP